MPRCEDCGKTVDRTWKHTASEKYDWVCSGCHSTMEPIGI